METKATTQKKSWPLVVGRVWGLALTLLWQAGPVLAAPPTAIPSDLKWETNTSFAPLGDPRAQRGGTITEYVTSFPLTFRPIGPDSNSSFRSYFDDNTLSLITLHPDTDEVVPQLATHWAADKDGRTVWFRLDKKARWSDGKPVTAEDYVYMLSFYRSKEIVDPWYNDNYTREIESITPFKEADGTEVLAVSLPKPKPDLYYYANVAPLPKHFYGKLTKTFVKDFNWKAAPVTGAYRMGDYQKGKSVTFVRVKDWWGDQHLYFKHRYNVDKVVVKVIRDSEVAYEYFKKGDLDIYAVNSSRAWHEKTVGPLYDDGYVHKAQIYNDTERSDYGMWLNADHDVFKDRDVRIGFQYAMNVDKVLKQVLRNDYNRLQGITRGYGKYTNNDIKARAFDLAKAEEHFKKAGWNSKGPDGIWQKNGRRLEATVTYDSPLVAQILVVLREEAKKAGFDLKLQEVDASTRYKSTREKKHQIAFMAWTTTFRPQYWESFHSDNAHKPQTNNITNTDNKDMDKAIDAYRDSTLEQDRIKWSKEVQRLVYDDAAFVPLFETSYFRVVYWPWIQLPKPPGTKKSDNLASMGDTGGRFWVDETAKQEVKAAMAAKRKLPKRVWVDETYRVKADTGAATTSEPAKK